MKKLSVTISGHRTSITLEDEFVDALNEIARARGQPVAKIINEIDKSRGRQPGSSNLSSAVRVYILKSLTQE